MGSLYVYLPSKSTTRRNNIQRMINTAILLSTYNGEKFVSHQLESILNQTYKDFILYVRDDGSTDATVAILNKYSQENENIVILSDGKNNKGASASFLWLLKNVEAKYYMFCDQDDFWLEDKVQLQVEEIEKSNSDQNHPIVVYHDLILTNKDGIVINNSFWDLHDFKTNEVQFDSLFVKNVLTGCACLINQSMKNEVLKYNVEKIFMYDHVIALIAYGFGKAIAIKKGLILYRDHSNSVTPKLKVSLLFRFTNFFKNINRKEYLMSSIIQLEEYLKNYENFLKKKDNLKAKSFVSLRFKAPLIRFIYLKANFKV